MEAAANRSFEHFFDDWIYGSQIPTVRFTVLSTTGNELKVRFDQAREFDLPITVSIAYTDGSSEDVVVEIANKTTERTIPLKGAVKNVDVNRDGAALAEFEK
jgi:hypothetical protein